VSGSSPVRELDHDRLDGSPRLVTAALLGTL